jgi:biotin carboxylase
MLTILCVATYFKGDAFLRECRQQGCTVILLTAESLATAAWPRESIDELHTIPRGADNAEIRRAVDAIARRHRIDRIAALDDFDVEMAAMLREHLQIAGMGRTTASRFRDKLAMRRNARAIGLPVPEFTDVFTDQTVNDWAGRVAPPWVLKPRSSAASTGIKKIAAVDALWQALDAAGDERTQCLLEQFVPGRVFHVDSIVWGGTVVFAVAFAYGRPPMEIAHDGGLFITKRLPDDAPESVALLDLNRRLQEGLGLRRGVSHTEFIGYASDSSHDPHSGGVRLQPDRYVFLETSARVGGAYIVDTIDAATGINLWREWAKVEIAGEQGTYSVPPHRRDYAGIVLSLARQEEPDMSGYTDPEIVTAIRKHHHAGVIVRSEDAARIDALLDSYSHRFYQDFFATAPAPDRPVE